MHLSTASAPGRPVLLCFPREHPSLAPPSLQRADRGERAIVNGGQECLCRASSAACPPGPARRDCYRGMRFTHRRERARQTLAIALSVAVETADERFCDRILNRCGRPRASAWPRTRFSGQPGAGECFR